MFPLCLYEAVVCRASCVWLGVEHVVVVVVVVVSGTHREQLVTVPLLLSADPPGPRPAAHLQEQPHVEQPARRPVHAAAVLHLPGGLPLLLPEAGSVHRAVGLMNQRIQSRRRSPLNPVSPACFQV